MASKEDYQVPTPTLRAHRPKLADVAFSSQTYRADVQDAETEDIPRRKRPGWFTRNAEPLGAGMIVMVVSLWFGVTYIVPFFTQTVDRWNCGEAQICHYDLDVGHGGKSHFITEYWRDQVIVIEFVGGNSSKAQVYSSTVIAVGDKGRPRMVTLTTDYLSRYPLQGKPDLVASVSGFTVPVIFYNTGTGFTVEGK